MHIGNTIFKKVVMTILHLISTVLSKNDVIGVLGVWTAEWEFTSE